MLKVRIQEAILQRLKQLEHYYYKSEYQKLTETLRSLEGEGWDKYRESLEIPTPENIKTILIFKPDEIGDAIFSLPAIAKLKEHYSGAKFFLICQKATSSIYKRTGFFDEISAIEVKKVFLRFSNSPDIEPHRNFFSDLPTPTFPPIITQVPTVKELIVQFSPVPFSQLI